MPAHSAPNAQEPVSAGWSFGAGWGSREQLDVTLVEFEPVVEAGIDVARDADGCTVRDPGRHTTG
ncbi:hypothetical protein [Streptomyces sp. NPDC001508]|uniref:hypothetical protein n=1 Tax=Streptomyces sp. NPDC001508 TaxID=3154656 RepID=UPI003326FC1D